MVDITHDWDDEDYVKSLNDGYNRYCKACYGDFDLHPSQKAETKQAFLSGIHWLATRESYCPDDLESALRKILGEHNPFIKQAANEQSNPRTTVSSDNRGVSAADDDRQPGRDSLAASE